MGKALVVLSGGQDSTTCLFWAKKQGYQVHAITFDYDQRHKIEIDAARRVAELASVESWECLALGPILKGTSPLVSDSRLEQYADHASLPGGLEKTFVPMRNQLFLTIACNRAALKEAFTIVTGLCEEDYGGYPDCRRDFVDQFERTANLGYSGRATDPFLVRTPLMNLTKKASVELALGLEGCYKALAYSHTAYDGQYPPLGHDHATLLRAKGFEEAGIPDPLILRAWSDALMDLPVTKNYTQPLGGIGKYMRLAGLTVG